MGVFIFVLQEASPLESPWNCALSSPQIWSACVVSVCEDACAHYVCADRHVMRHVLGLNANIRVNAMKQVISINMLTMYAHRTHLCVHDGARTHLAHKDVEERTRFLGQGGFKSPHN